MRDYDEDRSGSLNFEEFMTMVCQSTEFRFKLREADKAAAMQLLTAARKANGGSIPEGFAQMPVHDIPAGVHESAMF
jgi:hypothetical protein